MFGSQMFGQLVFGVALAVGPIPPPPTPAPQHGFAGGGSSHIGHYQGAREPIRNNLVNRHDEEDLQLILAVWLNLK